MYISETISISASAAAIFSADVGCGRPPKRKDMLGKFDERLGSKTMRTE